MRKLILFTVAVVFMLMTACSKIENFNEPNKESVELREIQVDNLNGSENQREDSSNSESSDTNGEIKVSDSSIDEIERYMNIFVRYFHEPFSIGEIQYPDTVLGLVFEYCFYNHDKLNGVEVDETSFNVSINSADFQEIACYLLGDDFEVTKDSHMVSLSGRYDAENDKYVTSFAKDYWGGDSFSIEFGSEIIIKENNGKINATADVGVWDEINGNHVPSRKLEYIFNIVDTNGVIYYQIEQIALVD